MKQRYFATQSIGILFAFLMKWIAIYHKKYKKKIGNNKSRNYSLISLVKQRISFTLKRVIKKRKYNVSMHIYNAKPSKCDFYLILRKSDHLSGSKNRDAKSKRQYPPPPKKRNFLGESNPEISQSSKSNPFFRNQILKFTLLISENMLFKSATYSFWICINTVYTRV